MKSVSAPFLSLVGAEQRWDLSWEAATMLDRSTRKHLDANWPYGYGIVLSCSACV